MNSQLALPVHTILDDVLVRSQRLERPSNFLISLSGTTIAERARSFMHSVLTDIENKEEAEKLIPQGQKLLAEETKAGDVMDEREKAREALKNINLSQTVEETAALSFHELSNVCHHNSIVNSVLGAQAGTDAVSDDFVFKALVARRQDKEAIMHREVVPSEATVPKYGFSGWDGIEDKRALSHQAEFFVSMLSEPPATYAENIATRLRDRQGLDIQRGLADTFDIIALMQREKDEMWKGSLTFLENQMKRLVTSLVDANLRNAKRKSATRDFGILPVIEGYWRLQRQGEDNPWGVLYYALRCGEKEAALEFAKDRADAFGDDVVSALKLYANEMVIYPKVRGSLMRYLNDAATSNPWDRFKVMALMVLVRESRWPADKESQAITCWEDWLWLRLHIGHDLAEIAKEIKPYLEDQQFVEDTANPFKKEQILLLTGQFEEAARTLLNSENAVNESLQVVLAMHVSNLISASVLKKDLLLFACDIFAADPVAALRYLVLIGDKKERIQAIAELAVEAPNGYDIVEKTDDDVGKSPLALVVDPREQKEVIRAAGVEAERRDQQSKAAKFYTLLQEYDHVIELECISLVQCIEGFRADEEAERLNNAIRLYEEIQVNGIRVSPEKFAEMRILIDVARARFLSRQGQYVQAASQIDQTGLFPESREKVMEKRERLNTLSLVQPHVWRIIPSALLIALKAYYETYKGVVPGSDGEGGQEVRVKSNAIIELTGYLDNISEDIQRQLLDLDGLISTSIRERL